MLRETKQEASAVVTTAAVLQSELQVVFVSCHNLLECPIPPSLLRDIARFALHCVHISLVVEFPPTAAMDRKGTNTAHSRLTRSATLRASLRANGFLTRGYPKIMI
jgi:hypothetical protein